MATEKIWRFLVVDDIQADEVEEFIAGDRLLAPDKIVVEKCTNFSEAIDKLETLRIDLIILDVKDDSIDLEDEDVLFAGEEVFNQIRQHRFVPVIFHTAYSHKIKHLEKPFVRIVNRTESRKLRDEIQEIFKTRLLHLIKHLEEEQRAYMWDYVQDHWKSPSSSHEQTDLTYLLSRRLANILERSSVKRFLAEREAGSLLEENDTIHPVEMYIYPSTNRKFLAGDILKGDFQGKYGYWIIMTPSCDLVQDKVVCVILAACFLIEDQPEFQKVQGYLDKGESPSNSAKQELQALIGNNRNAKHDGKRFQPNRYSFLPKTFFLPNLVIDYQSLIQVSLEEIKDEHRVASLDSPFAEECMARFAQYYGRLGTPDLDSDFVYNRIVESIKTE